MSDKKSFKDGFFSRFNWYWGLILGVITTSVIVIAAPLVIPNTFTANTPMVAADMNANFTAVVDRINQTPYGVLVSFSASQTIPNDSTDYVAQLDTIVKTNAPGTFDTGAYTFTVPIGEAGFYNIYYVGSHTNGCCRLMDFYYRVNAGANNYISSFGHTVSSVSRTVYLNDSDVVEFIFNNSKSSALNVNTTTTFVAIVRVL